MEKICVAIRVRPAIKQEPIKGNQWSLVDNTISLCSAIGTPIKGHAYAFDTVFGPEVKNADIYKEHAKDVVLSAVCGFNGTVFAYGQTSSGKTYTMRGFASDPGITRLAVHDVFRNIEKMTDREFLIRVSYMEIYNEEINDLLAPENRKLQIHESLERGIFVAGLREEIVGSVEQVLALVESGEAQRHFGETNMNVYSSRSHTIFRMVIESRDKSKDGDQDVDTSTPAPDAVRVSALNMVDLAGSERIAKTGAGGVRLREGTHINKSLTTLGIVINKLSDGGKQGGHVPYRDSKLTRILQPALGGNAKTAIICTVTPDEIHIEETRGTLQFASRAKRVTNCAQVNEIVTDAALLKRQKREIEELRRKLQGSPHSDQLEKEILCLRNDLLKFELERERLELELQEEKKAQVQRERRIKEQEQKIENLSTLVISSAIDDRDQPAKKGNRRETWCPRQQSSDLASQTFKRSTPGQDSSKGSLDNNLLVAVRSDRAFGLPPAFESLLDDEADTSWNNPSQVEDSPATPDFGNIADEETWASMNQYHLSTNVLCATNLFSEKHACSSGFNQDSSKISLLEHQLEEMKTQYQELQSTFDVKLQQGLQGAIEDATKSRQQLDILIKEKSKLEESLPLQTKPAMSFSRSEDSNVKKLVDEVEHLKLELKRSKQENMSLQVEAQELHSQLLRTETALQKCVDMDNDKMDDMDNGIHLLREKVNYFSGAMDGSILQQDDGPLCYQGNDGGESYDPEGLAIVKESESRYLCGECLVFSQEDADGKRPTGCSGSMKVTQVKVGSVYGKAEGRQVVSNQGDFPCSTTGATNSEPATSSSLSCYSTPCKRICEGKSLGGGRDAIVAALSCLCCRLRKLGEPLELAKDSSMKLPPLNANSTQKAKNLEVSLTSARRLTTQLVEELQTIVQHDFRCLNSHLHSYGMVGRLLEGLQVLLLENAEITFYLLRNTVQDMYPATDLKLQELSRAVGMIEDRMLEVGTHTSSHPKVSNGGLPDHAVESEALVGKEEEDRDSNSSRDPQPSCHQLLKKDGNDAECLEFLAGEAEVKGSTYRVGRSELHEFTGPVPICGHGNMEMDGTDKNNTLLEASVTPQDLIGVSLHDQGPRGRSAGDGGMGKDNGVVKPKPFGVQEVSGKKGTLSNTEGGISQSEVDIFAIQGGAEVIERLKMSGQHISMLDQQLVIQRTEKERISKVLIEQLNANEESMETLKFEKVRLAKELQHYMGVLAVHDEVVAAICVELKEFEKEMAQKREAQGSRDVGPPLARQEESSPGETSPQAAKGSELVQGRDRMLRNMSEQRKIELLETCAIHQRLITGHLTKAPEELEEGNSEGLESGYMHRQDASSHLLDHDSLKEGAATKSAAKNLLTISHDLSGKILNVNSRPFDKQDPGAEGFSLLELSLVGDCNEDILPCPIHDDQDVHVSNGREWVGKMSEPERRFTMQLLMKVDALEASLTAAKLEVVELKVEIEHLQTSGSMDGVGSELQTLKVVCENYKDEIRLLLEQVPTAETEMERESQISEIIKQNCSLELRLKKAEKRLEHAKGWRVQLLKLRKGERERDALLAQHEVALHDVHLRNARLEEEVGILKQALLKAQRLQSLAIEDTPDNTNSNKMTDMARSKSKVSEMVQGMELRMVLGSSASCRVQPVNSHLVHHEGITPKEAFSRRLHSKLPRAALVELSKNKMKDVERGLLKASKKPCHDQQAVRMGAPLDFDNKENQPGSMSLFHCSL